MWLMKQPAERLEGEQMANLLERVEELHRRLTELESIRVPPGPPEHRDLVALDRHFDARCDRLSQRLDELENRAPKPIPVVEPLASGDGLRPLKPDPLMSQLQNAMNQQRKDPHIEAIERGLLTPPKPYEERLLEEACGLLDRSLQFVLNEGNRRVQDDACLWGDLRDFLARARVTKAVP